MLAARSLFTIGRECAHALRADTGVAGGEAGGEAGGGGERQQQEQLFNTLEAQFERSRRMQYGRGSRGGF